MYAQAETVDRLRAKLRIPEVDINAEVPSIARVYDFLLGGKTTSPDRAQAEQVLEVYPQSGELARRARLFQARAVTCVAQAGVVQFLDVGCGLPTVPSTHETAQAVQPNARTVYADNHAQVLSHARNRLAAQPGVRAAAGDLAYPAETVYDWRTRRFLHFHQPVCLLLAMTMHFFPPDQAQKITAESTIRPPARQLRDHVGGRRGHRAGRGTGPHLYRRAGVQPRPRWPGPLDGRPGPDRAGDRPGPPVADPGVRARPAPGPGLGRRGPQTRSRARRAGDAMTGIPVTVEYLQAGWGEMYLFGYARDRRIAIRRDGIWFLAARTLAELGAEIVADQRKTPLQALPQRPRDLAQDYLATGHPATEPRPGEAEDVIEAAEAILRQPPPASIRPRPPQQTGRAGEELRALFPACGIHFSGQLHAWIARRHHSTICEGTAARLRTALTLIERQYPADPGSAQQPMTRRAGPYPAGITRCPRGCPAGSPRPRSRAGPGRSWPARGPGRDRPAEGRPDR